MFICMLVALGQNIDMLPALQFVVLSPAPPGCGSETPCSVGLSCCPVVPADRGQVCLLDTLPYCRFLPGSPRRTECSPCRQ
jgi:hypothetical protein